MLTARISLAFTVDHSYLETTTAATRAWYPIMYHPLWTLARVAWLIHSWFGGTRTTTTNTCYISASCPIPTRRWAALPFANKPIRTFLLVTKPFYHRLAICTLLRIHITAYYITYLYTITTTGTTLTPVTSDPLTATWRQALFYRKRFGRSEALPTVAWNNTSLETLVACYRTGAPLTRTPFTTGSFLAHLNDVRFIRAVSGIRINAWSITGSVAQATFCWARPPTRDNPPTTSRHETIPRWFRHLKGIA